MGREQGGPDTQGRAGGLVEVAAVEAGEESEGSEGWVVQVGGGT
jgi:hypothetical protein